MNKKKYSKQGKKNRAAGVRFEAKVRADLKSQGWIVDKWTNNVDLEDGKLVRVRNKFLGPGKPIMLGAGFPDFICFKIKGKGKNYEIIGVEVKRNGWINEGEREKCKWLLENKIFSKMLIAKEKKEGRNVSVEYINFEKKYNKPQ